MAKMKTLLASASILAGVAFAAPAYAAPTEAGTNVKNTVSVQYKVNDEDQDDVEDSNTFMVDRYVHFTFEESDDAPLGVKPGQQNAALTFTATNNSNAPIDILLTDLAIPTGSGIRVPDNWGNDKFDASSVTLWVDNKDGAPAELGVWDANDIQITTHVNNVAPGDMVTIFVVGNIPTSGRSNGDLAGYQLSASAGEVALVTPGTNTTAPVWDTSNTAGAMIAATSGANTSGMDTVFIDSQWVNLIQDQDAFEIETAMIRVLKSSKVLEDPVNGVSANAKMIPGAVVQYCIAVNNDASAAADATDITVSDILPPNVSLVAASIWTNVTATIDDAGTPNDTTDDVADCSTANTGADQTDVGFTPADPLTPLKGTVDADVSDLTPNSTKAVRFSVTID